MHCFVKKQQRRSEPLPCYRKHYCTGSCRTAARWRRCKSGATATGPPATPLVRAAASPHLPSRRRFAAAAAAAALPYSCRSCADVSSPPWYCNCTGTAAVNEVLMTADGETAVTLSKDATARVWHTSTGACRHVLEGERGRGQRCWLDGLKDRLFTTPFSSTGARETPIHLALPRPARRPHRFGAGGLHQRRGAPAGHLWLRQLCATVGPGHRALHRPRAAARHAAGQCPPRLAHLLAVTITTHAGVGVLL